MPSGWLGGAPCDSPARPSLTWRCGLFGRKKEIVKSNRGPARTVKLEVDPSGAPAVNLAKVREAGHVDLVKRAEKAGLALSRNGLGGIRAELVGVLDYSGSMYGAYRAKPDGAPSQVQVITERALGMGLQIDRDGKVPVITFGHDADHVATATVDNYQGIVEREVMVGPMGTTNLAAALRLVLRMAEVTEAPLFVFIVTDGVPDSKQEAEELLRELSHFPAFVKILATTDDARVWLEKLDNNLAGVLVDNIDAKFMADPDALSDLEFAQAMADEWSTWTDAALNAGVLVR